MVSPAHGSWLLDMWELCCFIIAVLHYVVAVECIIIDHFRMFGMRSAMHANSMRRLLHATLAVPFVGLLYARRSVYNMFFAPM